MRSSNALTVPTPMLPLRLLTPSLSSGIPASSTMQSWPHRRIMCCVSFLHLLAMTRVEGRPKVVCVFTRPVRVVVSARVLSVATSTLVDPLRDGSLGHSVTTLHRVVNHVGLVCLRSRARVGTANIGGFGCCSSARTFGTLILKPELYRAERLIQNPVAHMLYLG